MKALGNKYPNVYEVKKGKMRLLHTLNAYPGKTHFGEEVVRTNGQEYRYWDPGRSKLAADILRGLQGTYIKEGDVVLYLGSGHGYTPSYVSDVIGRKGMAFCLDFSPRVVRDLVYLCEERDNMAPIMGDANKPEEYARLLPEQVDTVFQDVAQKNQVQIFLKNVDKYLKDGGFGLLAVKARSIDVSRKPGEIFQEVRKELGEAVTVVEHRTLAPFEKDHALFVCRK